MRVALSVLLSAEVRHWCLVRLAVAPVMHCRVSVVLCGCGAMRGAMVALLYVLCDVVACVV